MFTNEFEFDETITTVMDDSGKLEDVIVHIDENEVYIRQWNETSQNHDIIVLSQKMFQEFLRSLNTSEGLYKLED